MEIAQPKFEIIGLVGGQVAARIKSIRTFELDPGLERVGHVLVRSLCAPSTVYQEDGDDAQTLFSPFRSLLTEHTV
ncbi:hypothetical protein SAMN05428953_11840 [Mesorhizobium muleiense]|uniref:Uncharacterized protein n=1 Tax=Mesorhizobium muleiense TaxID=1004279 RepID=A0A1G9DK36_9HYPH|nr:hypothetical protein SAMN05428953_11840 [Mesorhizobium muleiense]